jgi:hypothetical protein
MKYQLTRFLGWCRYRRFLNALLTVERRRGRVPDARLGELKADAWLAARATGQQWRQVLHEEAGVPGSVPRQRSAR